jgi:hypothetical protein
MERRMRVVLATVLVGVMVGCSTISNCGITGPAACAADRAAAVAGSWTQLSSANGRSVRMTLSARDTILTGTGAFTAAGGPGGAVQIDGFVFWRDSVIAPGGMLPAEPITILNFAFADGVTARFDQAKLFGQDTLKGVLTFSSSNRSDSYGVSFVRTTGLLP